MRVCACGCNQRPAGVAELPELQKQLALPKDCKWITRHLASDAQGVTESALGLGFLDDDDDAPLR